MASPSRVGSHSPASPRLPSPPPFPEVQIGPRSPSPSSSHSSFIPTPEDHPSEDYGAARRIRPGTKASDMASGPPLVPLAELDSAFQLQEHLKSLYLAATTSSSSPNHTQPITRASATQLSTPPPGIDRSLWLYELCRFLVQRANVLIVGFFSDNPPCSAANCPEMRASEWQYLCAVHDPPKSCCAIDYCCHTLDWAANILTSQRHFPSRLTLGPGGKEAANANQDAASVRHLTNIFRRVYRMFAHAWFQHRDVFWSIEGQEGLYVFYKTVCDVYSLIPEDNYTIPPEAEGEIDTEKPTDEGGWNRETLHGASSEAGKTNQPGLLEVGRNISSSLSEEYSSQANTSTTLGTGATTRRHKQTPSTGSFVTTIHEGDEESPSAANTTFASAANKPHIALTPATADADQGRSKTPKTAKLIEEQKPSPDVNKDSTSKMVSAAADPKKDNSEDNANKVQTPTIIEPESEDVSAAGKDTQAETSAQASAAEASTEVTPSTAETTAAAVTAANSVTED